MQKYSLLLIYTDGKYPVSAATMLLNAIELGNPFALNEQNGK